LSSFLLSHIVLVLFSGDGLPTFFLKVHSYNCEHLIDNLKRIVIFFEQTLFLWLFYYISFILDHERS